MIGVKVVDMIGVKVVYIVPCESLGSKDDRLEGA